MLKETCLTLCMSCFLFQCDAAMMRTPSLTQEPNQSEISSLTLKMRDCCLFSLFFLLFLERDLSGEEWVANKNGHLQFFIESYLKMNALYSRNSNAIIPTCFDVTYKIAAILTSIINPALFKEISPDDEKLYELLETLCPPDYEGESIDQVARLCPQYDACVLYSNLIRYFSNIDKKQMLADLKKIPCKYGALLEEKKQHLYSREHIPYEEQELIAEIRKIHSLENPNSPLIVNPWKTVPSQNSAPNLPLLLSKEYGIYPIIKYLELIECHFTAFYELISRLKLTINGVPTKLYLRFDVLKGIFIKNIAIKRSQEEAAILDAQLIFLRGNAPRYKTFNEFYDVFYKAFRTNIVVQ